MVWETWLGPTREKSTKESESTTLRRMEDFRRKSFTAENQMKGREVDEVEKVLEGAAGRKFLN